MHPINSGFILGVGWFQFTRSWMDYIMYKSCTHRVTMTIPCIECVCYTMPVLKQETAGVVIRVMS